MTSDNAFSYSLIGILLILSLFFLVGTKTEHESAIEVDSGGMSDWAYGSDRIYIRIDQAGRYSIAGKIVKLEELENAVRVTCNDDRGVAYVGCGVAIVPESGSPNGAFVRGVSTLRQAGIKVDYGVDAT